MHPGHSRCVFVKKATVFWVIAKALKYFARRMGRYEFPDKLGFSFYALSQEWTDVVTRVVSDGVYHFSVPMLVEVPSSSSGKSRFTTDTGEAVVATLVLL